MNGKLDRAKEALKRDWEQTKHDFNKKYGHDLDQSIGDTVRQATGSEPLPSGSLPNRS
ncbi:MAG: hypothetical protein ACT4TC_16505 [Myxococcaceae bacterium]